MRILNINFQSIKNKQHLVHNILDSLKPDIVIGTETWLNPNIKDTELAFSDKYKVYRRARTGQQGGGVLFAINKNFFSDEVEELHPGNDCEIIWAKLEITGSKTLYISTYYNPKTSDEKSLKSFDTSVRRASQIKTAALFIGGDLNLPGWDWKNKKLNPNTVHTKNHYEFGNTLDYRGLVQLIELQKMYLQDKKTLLI